MWWQNLDPDPEQDPHWGRMLDPGTDPHWGQRMRNADKSLSLALVPPPPFPIRLIVSFQLWPVSRIHRIRIFLSLLDPDQDPIVRGTDPDPSIIKQRKTLIPTVLLLLYDFFSLKNDVNVASKSTKQKTFIFSCHTKVHWRKYQDPDPNPLINGSESGSVSQRCGSGSVPKCHGSASLAMTLCSFPLGEGSCAMRSCRAWLLQEGAESKSWPAHSLGENRTDQGQVF